jgi:hypothetical protein
VHIEGFDSILLKMAKYRNSAPARFVFWKYAGGDTADFM